MKINYICLGIFLTILLGCNNKILEKQYGSNIYKFQFYKLKSNDCIKNDLPWLDEIVQNKGMYLIKDENFGEERFDYRFLDDYSFRLLYGNMNDLNTSECFATQGQFFNFFGKLENKSLRSDKFSDGKVYLLYFVNIDDVYKYGTIKGIHTQAYFKKNGERDFIASHFMEPIE